MSKAEYKAIMEVLGEILIALREILGRGPAPVEAQEVGQD